MKALIGTKLGMSSLIADDGKVTPVTLVQAGPMTVIRTKSTESDGYEAVVTGYGKSNTLNKAQADMLKKTKASAKHIGEFRASTDLQPGETYGVDVFSVGDKVKVSGISKGKGFAGTIKRHNFSRGPKTHGSTNYRKPGSIGSMYPQKVVKGKKMAGRMGATKVSVRNLTVAMIDKDKDLIALVGAVPGPNRGTVRIEAV